MNRVILIGNVGRDVEVRWTQKKEAVATISLATNAGKDKTDWHTVKCFGKTAEICAGVTKGAKLVVEGRLTYSRFEKDGQVRVFAEVIADRVEFLSPKSRADSPSGDKEGIPF